MVDMKKIVALFLAIFCFLTLPSISVKAEELRDVMGCHTGENSITVYLKNQEKEIDHIYIGNQECSDYETGEPGAVHTVAIIDNSLSIQEEYRETIKTFLTELTAARNEGDTFTIATFAENITYLVQDSSDYLKIREKVDSINFVDQESYLTKTLYTVMDDLQENSEDDRYTRIIIIADGAENEALGYTDEELTRRIEETCIPVYTIGCRTGANEENLKKMFSISRMSNAREYLLDETEPAEILQDILNGTDLIRVDIFPEDELCDGTRQPVRIGFGEGFCTVEAVMPFRAETPVAETNVPEKAVEEAEEVEQTTVVLTEEDTGFPVPILLVAAFGIFLIAVIAAAVILVKKGKQKEPEQKDVDLSEIGHSRETLLSSQKSGDGTEILNQGQTAGPAKTDIINGGKTVKLCLQDIHDPTKTFEYPLRGAVLIGKDEARCQVVINYNKYVSAVHCEILPKGNGYVVRDGGDTVIASTNGTFVDGVKAAPELALPAGSVLKLGEVSLKVTYR